MSIKLVNAYVLVKRDEPITRTAGGLIIPDMGLRKSETGTVRAVGTARFESGKEMEFDVNVGDTILFRKLESDTVTVDGEELLLLPFSHVIGVVA
jgi:chaperonin GroES